MKLQLPLPARGPAALALSACLLAGPALGQDGELTYDRYDSSWPVPNKVQSDATRTFASGETRTLTIEHLRNPRNTGHNDLVLTVDNLLTGTATIWLVKDGSQTLSFPPYIPGADLTVRKVECLEFATIEDARFLWDALGGSPSELAADFSEAANAGAQQAMAAVQAAAATAMDGLTEAGLAMQQQLLTNLEQAAAAVSDGVAQADAFVESEFPELHEALVATASFRPTGTFEDARARIDEILEALSSFQLQLPCEVDVEVVARFGVSLDEFQAELASWLADGPVPPEALCELFAELRGTFACLEGASDVAEALGRDVDALLAYLERVRAMLAGLDTRLFGPSGRNVARAADRLLRDTVRLHRDLVELKRRADVVDAAQADFETSYEKIHGPSSPFDIWIQVLDDVLPTSLLPSLDPEQTQTDLEVHQRNTERLADAIAARDAQWATIATSFGRWTEDAGRLATALANLRLRSRGVDELIATLRSIPSFEAPGAAAKAVAECVDLALQAAEAGLAFLAELAQGLRDWMLPPELAERVAALDAALRAFREQHVVVAAAAKDLVQERAQLIAAVSQLGVAVAGPSVSEASVEAHLERVRRETDEVVSAQRRLSSELARLRQDRDALAAATRELLDALMARPKEELAKLASLIEAAQGIVTLELEVRGLESTLESCTQALVDFRNDFVRQVSELVGKVAAKQREMMQQLSELLAEQNEMRMRLVSNLGALQSAAWNATAGLPARPTFEDLIALFADPAAAEALKAIEKDVFAMFHASRQALEQYDECDREGLLIMLAGGAVGTAVGGPVGGLVGAGIAPVVVGDKQPGQTSRLPGVREDLLECRRIALLWITAFERTPGRVASCLAELAGVDAAAIEAQLAELQGLLEEGQRCFGEAQAALARLAPVARAQQAAAFAAQLPSEASGVLEGLASLFDPMEGWSIETIASKIEQGMALVAELNGVSDTAVAKLHELARADLDAVVSAATCTRSNLVDFSTLAQQVQQALESAEDALPSGVNPKLPIGQLTLSQAMTTGTVGSSAASTGSEPAQASKPGSQKPPVSEPTFGTKPTLGIKPTGKPGTPPPTGKTPLRRRP